MTKEEILKLSREELIAEIDRRLINKIDLSNLSVKKLQKLLMEMNKV